MQEGIIAKKNGGLSFSAKAGGITHSLIIGDNLDALGYLLREHREKVDIIYIDPPYGEDGKGKSAEVNYENKIGRQELVAMLQPRIALAKDILKDGGVFFCSIDERNYARVRLMLDDVFGECDYYGTFIQLKRNTQNDAKTIQKNHEYILCYVKRYDGTLILFCENEVRKSVLNDHWIRGTDNVNGQKTLMERPNTGYTIYLLESSEQEEFEALADLADGFCLRYGNFSYFIHNGKFIHALAVNDQDKEKARSGCQDEAEVYSDCVDLLAAGYKITRHPRTRGMLGSWSWSLENFRESWNSGDIEVFHGKKNTNFYRKINISPDNIKEIDGKKYYFQKNILPLKSIIDIPNSVGTTLLKSIIGGTHFKHPKNPEMLKYLFRAYNKKDAIILDFFAGSGSTGQAVMDLNREDGGKRQFILCTNNLDQDGRIAETVAAPRLSRVMRGHDYDGTDNFDWLTKNSPYGDGLEVKEIFSKKFFLTETRS